MKCRDFQVENDLQPEGLSESARRHLGECAGCQKVQADQTRLLEMLGGLEPVDVPKDFNVQVRARIARGRPASPSVLFPALRYILPLALVLAVISYIAINGLFFAEPKPDLSQSNQAESVENNIAPPAELVAREETTISSSEDRSEESASVPAMKSAEGRELIVGKVKDVSNPGNSSKTRPKPEVLRDSGGGSQVLSVSPGQEVITPRGINTNTQTLPAAPNLIPQTFTVTEVLSLIGIEISADDESRRVKSVTQNSPAERSGVKTGDFIEEIDGKPLVGENLRERSFQGNKLTVRRSGKRLEIVISTQ